MTKRTQGRSSNRLFTSPEPGSEEDFLDHLNPDSLETVEAMVEPALSGIEAGSTFQFERTGYFGADAVEHTAKQPVFNRAVTLRDTWARIKKRGNR